MIFPSDIRTDRLLLRAWRPGDATRMKEAIDANLAHLQPWMPWAMDEPSPLDVIVARVENYAAAFVNDVEWFYGVYNSDGATVVGGAGLHPRLEADGLEIGYWIAASETRKGYATETAMALGAVAFSQPHIQRIQIRCDPRNVASAGVPRRLGYRYIETLKGDTVTPTGEPRDTMVWELTRADHDTFAEISV